ncbi:hypothetical protein J2Z32_002363 [Paenibacillus turicensis]|uniref:CAAX prenyl protease 2/Lysostaphin resistance protein A-like domain-containing protein n=1 Tax=Paenibacillus turicensis TaxID=160487 RepID=A0ABS4FT22_9BACL|nr:CPBP family intramembrane glutamic endopeptidase [Paenibacillus turicensis]MBP1905715.1 hypothetical protein [Paenibacillus turicensis]
MYSSLVVALILFVLCLPGIWLMSKNSVADFIAQSKGSISERNFFILNFLVMTIFINLSISAGIYFGSKIGLKDLFLEGIGNGNIILINLLQQVGVGTVGGIICGLVWVVSYYKFIRNRMDKTSVQASEQLRQQLGLTVQITSGGIVEEIIFRWGLLSLTMWAVLKLIPSEAIAFWASILITGIIFGLAHLPGYVEKGFVISPFLIFVMLYGNLWVSIVCGYLFWKFGIIAAILVHMLFHVVWYLCELKNKGKNERETINYS